MNPKKFLVKQTILVTVLLAIVHLSPRPAQAHRVTVFAWAEGDTVHTESKFSGGKPVHGGKITVYDEQDHVVLTGVTDEKGAFSFPTPPASALKIEMEAGLGHKNHWVMASGEFSPDGAAAEEHREKKQPADAKTIAPAREIRQTAPLTPGDIETAVEKALDKKLDKKLAPLIKMMAQSRDKGPTARDVFGGIGYIIGLVGIAAYVNYRKKSPGEGKTGRGKTGRSKN